MKIYKPIIELAMYLLCNKTVIYLYFFMWKHQKGAYAKDFPLKGKGGATAE